MLAKRLGVSAGCVSRAERNEDVPITSALLRAGLKAAKQPFADWSEARDGPRSKLPHVKKRATGRTRAKTTGKPAAKKQGDSSKRPATTTRLLRRGRSSGDQESLGLGGEEPKMSMAERNANEMAETLGWETGEAVPVSEGSGESPKGTRLRLTRAATRRAQFKAIEEYGGCPECGDAPINDAGSHSPAWNDKVRCGKCAYGYITLWRWCGRTGKPRPGMEKPPLGKAPDFTKRDWSQRVRKCMKCDGSGRADRGGAMSPFPCPACDGTGCVSVEHPADATTKRPEDILKERTRSTAAHCAHCGASGKVDRLLESLTTKGAEWRCLDVHACTARKQALGRPVLLQNDTKTAKRTPNFVAMTFEQGEEIIRLLGKLVEVWE
jgi:transcription elongation factor Elf1